MSARLPLADIRFLADFHAYCLTRGDEAYRFMSNSNCALAQFLRDTGRAVNPQVGGYGGWSEGDGPDSPTIFSVGKDPLSANPETFSALATRLEALLADAPAVELVQ